MSESPVTIKIILNLAAEMVPETHCPDCGIKLRCSDCAELVTNDECPVMLPDNGPDLYCPNCDPEIHAGATDRAETLRRFEALERQTDIDTGYDPYND